MSLPLHVQIEHLEYPQHLNMHSLSDHELFLYSTEEARTIAKTLNIIQRQNDWSIRQIVFIHNVMREQDMLLEKWKFSLWVLAGLGGSGGVVALLVAIIKHF